MEIKEMRKDMCVWKMWQFEQTSSFIHLVPVATIHSTPLLRFFYIMLLLFCF